MLVQRQETEQELNQRIQKLSTEKSSLVERIASLQRTLANMETEKREVERQVNRQEKDKSALKKTLDKVSFADYHGVATCKYIKRPVLMLFSFTLNIIQFYRLKSG